MKKFMKFCAITALVLIATGTVIATIASAIKGPATIAEIVYSVTDGKVRLGLDDVKDWGFEVGNAVGDALHGGLERFGEVPDYDIDEKLNFHSGFEILTGNVKDSFSADKIRSLDVEAGACHLIFKDSYDDDFHIEADNVGKMQSYIEGGTLNIKTVRKTTVGKKSCTITLYIPKDFRFKETDVEIGAGLLEFENLSADEISIEVGAGEVSNSGLLQVNELNLEVGMGSVILSAMCESDADIECAMGSIELELSGSETDYNYYIESAMGSVDIGSYSVSGLAGGRKIDNDAGCDINLECSMGSIEIGFMD